MAKYIDSDDSNSSLDDIDSVAKFEEVLRENLDTIAKNLNVTSWLFSKISFSGIISEDDRGKILAYHQMNQVEMAARAFLEVILQSTDPTKWSVFKDALEGCEGTDIIKEILCNGMTKSLMKHKCHQEQIKLHRGNIVDKVEVLLLSNHLLQEHLLTSQEYEEVMAKYYNKGNTMAVDQTLTFVSKRKDFYRKMLDILWKMKIRSTVREIDTDYYNEKIRNEDSRCSNLNESYDENDPEVSKSYRRFDDAIASHIVEYTSPACCIDDCCTAYDCDVKVMNTVKCLDLCSTNNLNDEGPIASRTRAKTKLQQETVLMNDEKPASPCKQPLLGDSHHKGTQQQSMSDHRHLESTVRQPMLDHRHPESTLQQPRSDHRHPESTLQQPMSDHRQNKIMHHQPMDKQTVILLKLFLIDHKQSVALHKQPASSFKQPEVNDGQHISSPDVLTLMDTRREGLHPQQMVDHRQHGNSHKQSVLNYKQPDNTPRQRDVAAENPAGIHPSTLHASEVNKSLTKSNDAVTPANLPKILKQTLVRCECTKTFISEDSLKKHQKTECKVLTESSRRCPKSTGNKEATKLVEKQSKQPELRSAAPGHIKKTFKVEATADISMCSKNNKLQIEVNRLTKCSCGIIFTSQEALKRHQMFDCQRRQSQALADTSLQQHNNGQHCLEKMATLYFQDASGNFKTAGNRRASECDLKDRERNSPCTDKQLHQSMEDRSTQGRDCRERRVQKTSHKNVTQNNTSFPQQNIQKSLKRCVCGMTFISEFTLENHQKETCTKLQQGFSHQKILKNSGNESRQTVVESSRAELSAKHHKTTLHHDQAEGFRSCGIVDSFEPMSMDSSKEECTETWQHKDRESSHKHAMVNQKQPISSYTQSEKSCNAQILDRKQPDSPHKPHLLNHRQPKSSHTQQILDHTKPESSHELPLLAHRQPDISGEQSDMRAVGPAGIRCPESPGHGGNDKESRFKQKFTRDSNNTLDPTQIVSCTCRARFFTDADLKKQQQTACNGNKTMKQTTDNEHVTGKECEERQQHQATDAPSPRPVPSNMTSSTRTQNIIESPSTKDKVIQQCNNTVTSRRLTGSEAIETTVKNISPADDLSTVQKVNTNDRATEKDKGETQKTTYRGFGFQSDRTLQCDND